ncbi:Copper chaperone CopZ [Ekhidna lutea]|uniref:Mercuric transport protein MerT n=1 Tax=Ekhidna lutea TaxID=447679 RepID=A0A239GTH4_EKHLU|nr:mercuric transport protein MerTP [Ekhidna lutea]SNS72427.1 Copper chaperone CopZ [Ekhidna lutea]
MNTTNHTSRQTSLSSKSASAGLFAAIVASLCCITPVFSLLAGIGGIAATFSWMEPFRPYLIVLTIGILGFAWYQKLRPRTAEEIACECETGKQPSFWQSKKFLGIITVFAGLMLSFPSYAHIFYSNGGSQTPAAFFEQDSTKTDKIVLDVKGMTCAGCEAHVNKAVNQLEGIYEVKASYEEGTTQVKYNSEIIEVQTIIEAINKTGYKAIDSKKKLK